MERVGRVGKTDTFTVEEEWSRAEDIQSFGKLWPSRLVSSVCQSMTTRLFGIGRSKTSSSCVEEEGIDPLTWCFQSDGPDEEAVPDEAVVHHKGPFHICLNISAAHWMSRSLLATVLCESCRWP